MRATIMSTVKNIAMLALSTRYIVNKCALGSDNISIVANCVPIGQIDARTPNSQKSTSPSTVPVVDDVLTIEEVD
jgi:hypothetical protein